MEPVHVSDSTEATSKVGLGPSCLLQSYLAPSCFGEWPTWQHFTDGKRIQGTDPEGFFSSQFNIHRGVANLEQNHLNPDLILKATVCVPQCHLLCAYIWHMFC